MTGVQTCALPICFPVTILGLSILEKVYGNVKGGVGKIFDIITTGIGIKQSHSNNPVENILEKMYAWFFVIVNLLLVVEGIFIAYSKKYT